MAKPRAILKRRQSVQNIAKITKTMQMIATAKFKRSHDRAVAARPYTDKLTALIGDLAAAAGSDFEHPLLTQHKAKRVVLVGITSNRGLCGGYNSNIGKRVIQARRDLLARGLEVELVACGKRLGTMMRYQKVPVDRLVTHIEDRPTFAEVDALGSEFLERFAQNEIDEVHIVYTKFVSASRQQPVTEQVLPLEPPTAAAGETNHQYIFHPGAEAILSDLLPRSVRLHLFQAFLDAAVSEQTARMVAMKSATDNALDMIRDLTRYYNRSRQNLITTELSEIIGGAAAVE